MTIKEWYKIWFLQKNSQKADQKRGFGQFDAQIVFYRYFGRVKSELRA